MTTQQVVLVTGSSSGMGRLTVETLARARYKTYASMRDVTDRNAQAAKELQTLAETETLPLHVLDLDIISDASVEGAIQTIVEQSGRLDILVNNAAVMSVGITEAFTLEQVRNQFETNFFSVVRMMRSVLPTMRQQQSGLVINVTAIGGRLVFPFFGIYGASKTALEWLSESYHYEVAPFGVEVSILEPGAYPTGLIARIPRPQDGDRLAQYGDFAQFPEHMITAFEQSFEGGGAPNTQEIADAILQLIQTAPGQRPIRTLVGANDYGVRDLNVNSAKHQQALIEQLQLPGFASLIQ